MTVILICALFFAFVICVRFGKRFIPWLKEKDSIQPIKEEVASIYDARENGSPEEHGNPGAKR